MLEVEEQRRLAAIASRARSRIVSRAEGAFDESKFAERTDVAKAAAEQLRKLVESTRGTVSYTGATVELAHCVPRPNIASNRKPLAHIQRLRLPCRNSRTECDYH